MVERTLRPAKGLRDPQWPVAQVLHYSGQFSGKHAMNMFEALAYLLVPAILIFGLTLGVMRSTQLVLPKASFLAGVGAGLVSVAISVALVYLRWNNPDEAVAGKPIYDLAVLPLIGMLGVVLGSIGIFRLRVTRWALLSGCGCTVVSAVATLGLLRFYFTG
jgi:hypothetical protein